MKPILIYDGNCGFCKKWVQRWKVLTEDKVDYVELDVKFNRYAQVALENNKDLTNIETTMILQVRPNAITELIQ